MPKRQTNAVLLFSPGLEEVEAFATSLNTESFWFDSPAEGKVLKDYRGVQRELRRLVNAWFDSGPNVSRLLQADPVLAQHARTFRANLIPTKTGHARLTYLTAPERMPGGTPLATALGLFISFLLNPHNERLGGPCARCGNYYVKNTKRQTVYCSQRCGLRYTARIANENRRKLEHAEQLEIAMRAASQWTTAKTTLEWKDWVFRRTRISKNWLTRAVAAKELFEPLRRHRT